MVTSGLFSVCSIQYFSSPRGVEVKKAQAIASRLRVLEAYELPHRHHVEDFLG
jgi:hypothetical protein